MEPCVYCGLPGNTVDHVPPRSSRATIISQGLYDKHPFLVVPACFECNVLLSDDMWTVLERKRYIKKKLQQRYRKILRMPDWSEAEIADISPKLQKHVRDGLKLKALITERITW